MIDKTDRQTDRNGIKRSERRGNLSSFQRQNKFFSPDHQNSARYLGSPLYVLCKAEAGRPLLSSRLLGLHCKAISEKQYFGSPVQGEPELNYAIE